MLRRTGAKEGDIIFLTGGTFEATCKGLYALRKRIGAELKLYDPQAMHFSWIVEFPMFEWDAEERTRYLSELGRNVAAAHASEEGSWTALELLLGKKRHYLSRALAGYNPKKPRSQKISADLALAIERACHGAVTRKDLRPDLFES